MAEIKRNSLRGLTDDEKKQYYAKKANKWSKENLDRIMMLVPKGDRAKIKEIAKRKGYSSTNAYLNALVKKDNEE